MPMTDLLRNLSDPAPSLDLQFAGRGLMFVRHRLATRLLKTTVGGEYAARFCVEPVSGNIGESIQIRPRGYGLVPFLLLSLGFPLLLFYSAWVSTNSNHVALLAATILAIGALATWVLAYRWRARIMVNSHDGTLQVRGRLVTQTIQRRDVHSAVLYGSGYNQAVAYLDRHERRLLTLRLGYWSLSDIERVNDRLEIFLHERKKPAYSPPGKGLLPSMERQQNWVGVAMFLIIFTGALLARGLWSWCPDNRCGGGEATQSPLR
jgi:hypothetical protein